MSFQKNPHSDTEVWLLARTFWAALAKYSARCGEPKFPHRLWLRSLRDDLQSVTVNGSREKIQEKEEERSGGRNERGLNQCHPLQFGAKKDRCSLCLFVCAWGCMPAQARINQELFCFESISALTNLILDQCKSECNTYWVKFKLNLTLNACCSLQHSTFFSLN